jgi:hypothetical protein
MNEQKNGVIHVLAAHFDPLINAADADGLKAVDALGRSNGAPVKNFVLQIFSIQQRRRKGHNYQADNRAPAVFENLFDHV